MERITHAIRKEYWMQVVKECNESGIMKKVWLAQHNISPKAFYRWQKKLRMETGTELPKHVHDLETGIPEELFPWSEKFLQELFRQ